MSWLSLILAVIKLGNFLFDYAEKRSLINEGEARAIKTSLENFRDRADKAVAARANVDAGDGLHDDDGYRRD